ncbi:MAG: hypothetical protein LBD50_00200 [Rickettsiales bacterium]|nr:hypothetical protein [Rickettsiales bacterium]
MKKQMSLFIWAVAVFGMSNVWAATNSGMRGASSADLTGAPGVRSRTSVDYEKYETRSSTKTYSSKDGKNIYYAEPSKRSELYKEHSSESSSSSKRVSRSENTRSETKRKYYLAHPFFQPLKGKFGSVTELAYNKSSYGFKINPISSVSLSDLDAKWGVSQFAIKEDLSFGISDRLAVQGMAIYDSTKYKADWNVAPDDEIKDSGVNLYGLGLQWRFVDNSEWIATLSGYYQRQVDVSNIFIADLKAGYKIETSTIYGLARGWMANFDGNAHGDGIMTDNSAFLIAYKTNDKSASYFEGGFGIFSVLDEDWTLNLEAVFGNYEWHNQGSVKAAFGWQPGNSFAVNLYAKTSIYDSANGKELEFWWYEPATSYTSFTNVGTAKIDDYSETSIGLQAVLYF